MRAFLVGLLLFSAACSVNPPCKGEAKCTVGTQWDPDKCGCIADGSDAGVPDAAMLGDLACNSSCGGGGAGCSAQCGACGTGELCCAWAGGACQIDADAGTCTGNSGFHCVAATGGVCPNQCFP